MSTNNAQSRSHYAREISQAENLRETVHNLILEGDTGVDVPLVPGTDFHGRIKFVSAVTLADVLAPLDRVDLLESDIQQAEQVVLPAAMDVIKEKVKRVHIGTHGGNVHDMLLQEFARRRFEIIFNYEPDTHHDTAWGSFNICDGIITARNLDLR